MDESIGDGRDFQYPSPEEYKPSLQETFVSSVNDVSFGHEDAVNLRRVIGDVCAATPPVLSVAMPCMGTAWHSPRSR